MSEHAFTRSRGGGYVLRLGTEERALVSRLFDELSSLLTNPTDAVMTGRLFQIGRAHV